MEVFLDPCATFLFGHDITRKRSTPRAVIVGEEGEYQQQKSPCKSAFGVQIRKNATLTTKAQRHKDESKGSAYA
jgi:hypothetical protein